MFTSQNSKENFQAAQALAIEIEGACFTMCHHVAEYRSRVQVIASVLETFISEYSNRK